jgi:hypothetical protein
LLRGQPGLGLAGRRGPPAVPEAAFGDGPATNRDSLAQPAGQASAPPSRRVRRKAKNAHAPAQLRERGFSGVLWRGVRGSRRSARMTVFMALRASGVYPRNKLSA